MMYTHDWLLMIDAQFTRITVNYAIPYVPAEGDRYYDENDSEHLKYIENSKSIYSTKVRGTKAYYFLFKSLRSKFRTFARYTDIACIIPIASSKNLVYMFAEEMAKHLNCNIVDCLERIGESTYRLKEGFSLPDGNILLVDDVTTTGGAIENAINCILEGYEVDLAEIKTLCIGKTQRNLFEWDLQKEEDDYQAI